MFINMRIIVLLPLLVFHVAAEIFSSTVLLRRAVDKVKTFDMQEYISIYVGKNETRRVLFQPALDHLKELNSLINDPVFRIPHPIFAYKFIRLQVLVSNIVQKHITDRPDLNNTQLDWSKFEDHLAMVTRNDLVGSIAGLAKLQHIYKLNTNDMADGKIGEYSSVSLSAAECLEFAEVVRNTEIDTVFVNTLPIAIRWLEEARERIEQQQDKTTDLGHILQSYKNLYIEAGCECTEAAQKIYSEMQSLSVSVANKTRCDSTYNDVCKALTKPSNTHPRTMRFHGLCRQDKVTLPPESVGHVTAAHRLRCRYVHNDDPRLLLQPIKLEELNTLPPYAARFHDIITEKEIDFLKTVSPTSFKRGTIVAKKGRVVSKTKVSQTTTLPLKYTRNELKKLIGRIQAATQLNQGGFEDLVVANYGTGGHYGFHVDFNFDSYQTDPDFVSKNQLIFTIILYLTDVEAGGQTCFPNIGVTVPPIKATALMFRNLYSNGSAVIESIHTSCPVMVGEKWIAIQWVRSFPQLFNYPCSLKSED